jgi:hypothetical protein
MNTCESGIATNFSGRGVQTLSFEIGQERPYAIGESFCMRAEIQRLVELGRLPCEDNADVELLRQYEAEYRKIKRPVTDEEAIALVGLFGDDGCFGLASSVMHLVETAPGWPIREVLTAIDNPWILELKNRAIRGGLLRD